jgi:hypothetical protein
MASAKSEKYVAGSVRVEQVFGVCWVETRCSSLLREPTQIMGCPLQASQSPSGGRPWKQIPSTRVGLRGDCLKKAVLVLLLRGGSVGPLFVATAHHDGERGAKLFVERIISWTTMAKDQIQRKQRSAIFAISNRLGAQTK